MSQKVEFQCILMGLVGLDRVSKNLQESYQVQNSPNSKSLYEVITSFNELQPVLKNFNIILRSHDKPSAGLEFNGTFTSH